MRNVSFLANENFPQMSVEYLRACGFEVDYVAEGNPGIKDQEVIDFANEKGRKILTFDSDYGDLIFRGMLSPNFGVLYLRLGHYQPDDPGKMVESLTQTDGFRTGRILYVLSEGLVRQREY